jgi:hypothetical protein
LTPAAQPTGGGRRSGMRGTGETEEGSPAPLLCKGKREPVSAPALVYAPICFLVTAAFFAVFLGAASGLAPVGFVVSAFFAAGLLLGC